MTRLKAILIVPLVLALAIVPFSLLLGWSLFTLGLFWFIVVPVLAVNAPRWVSKQSQPLPSIIGLLIFYGLIVFMTYDHFQSDFYQVLIWSGVINLVVVAIISIFGGQRKVTASQV